MENVDRQGIGTSTRNPLHRLVSVQSLAERPIQSPEDGKDGNWSTLLLSRTTTARRSLPRDGT